MSCLKSVEYHPDRNVLATQTKNKKAHNYCPYRVFHLLYKDIRTKLVWPNQSSDHLFPNRFNVKLQKVLRLSLRLFVRPTAKRKEVEKVLQIPKFLNFDIFLFSRLISFFRDCDKASSGINTTSKNSLQLYIVPNTFSSVELLLVPMYVISSSPIEPKQLTAFPTTSPLAAIHR